MGGWMFFVLGKAHLGRLSRNTLALERSTYSPPSHMLSRRSKTNFALCSYLAATLLLHVVLAWSVAESVRNGYSDFKIFYTAAKIIRAGQGSQLYDEATQLQVQKSFAPKAILRAGLLPYNHPPFEALLFVPFSFLPYWAAFFAWDVVNLGILFVLARLLRPHVACLQQLTTLTCVLASLAFLPIFVAFIQGQDILVLLLLFTLAFVALRNKSDWTAGCWLGLGLFRFHQLLPIVFALLWQRRARAIYGFLSVGLGLAVLSVATIGWRAALSYPSAVLAMERNMFQRGTIGPLNMPNLHGLFADMSLPARGWQMEGIIFVVSVGLVVFAAIRWERIQATAFPLGFSLCLLATVSTAYHGFCYDLSLMILAIVLIVDFVEARRLTRWNTSALLVPALVLSLSPLQLFLWLRLDRFGFIVVILLFWFWAIARATTNITDEQICAS
jgi:hypothetical protein